jgi:hypothetical protein
VLALLQMAESQGLSQAELIRDALQAYARKARRPKLSGMEEFDSGPTDTSARTDDILTRAAKRSRLR